MPPVEFETELLKTSSKIQELWISTQLFMEELLVGEAFEVINVRSEDMFVCVSFSQLNIIM